MAGHGPSTAAARRLYMREYMRRRRRDDPSMRMRNRLQARLRCCAKSARTAELLGCTLREAAEVLSTGPGMELDHIIPCARFDLADPNQQRACFSVCNLQTLDAQSNRRKSARLPTAVQQAELIHGSMFWRTLPFGETARILRGLRDSHGGVPLL